MSNDITHAQLIALLSQYAAGSINADALRTQLAAPQIAAALRTLVGQTLATANGDQIAIGDAANAKGVAIGGDTLLIDGIAVRVAHRVQGNQTTIAGDVSGPVLSGTFSGPVTIYATPPPNPAATESRPPPPTVAALKRATLERRIAALSEEYSAINQQIDTTIDAAQKVRLERRAADLLSEIARLEAEISG
jgi:hypothetical protein